MQLLSRNSETYQLGSRANMLLSTSMFSVSGYFCIEAGGVFGSWVVLLARFGVPLLVLGIALAPRAVGHLRQIQGLCLLRAAFMVASQWLFLECARRGGLFLALLLYNTGPLFVVPLEAAYHRKPLAWSAMARAGVGFAGVWLLQTPGHASGTIALALGLASGACYAVSQFTLFLASRRQSAIAVLLQTVFWCSAMALLPALASLRGMSPQASPDWLAAAAWMALGGLCSLGNQWFRTLAYKRAADASSLAPLLYFGIVVGAALDSLRTGRLPGTMQWLGAACIVAAALGAGRQAAATPRQREVDLAPEARNA